MGSSIQRLAGTLFGFESCSLASQSVHLLEKTLFGTAAKTKQGLSISEANLITTRLGALPQCFLIIPGSRKKLSQLVTNHLDSLLLVPREIAEEKNLRTTICQTQMPCSDVRHR